MIIDGWGAFQVGGVVESPSLKTHIPIEIVLPLTVASTLEKKGFIAKTSLDWDSFKSTSVYVLTQSSKDLVKLNQQLEQVLKTNKSKSNSQLYLAQNLEDITPWDPALQNDIHAGMNWRGIMTWVFLALALTLLAAFNYTALSVARILSRAKEVGIRKTNGARRHQIFFQFVIEAILLSIASLLIACVIILSMDKSGRIGMLNELNFKPDFQLIAVLMIYTLLTGFVAGAIPAVVLSNFKAVDVLKNLQTIRLVRRVNLYRGIIVIQFSVTIALMIFFVILKDMGQSAQQDLISKLPENVTVIDMKNKDASLLADQIMQISQVQSVSKSDHLPVMNPPERCTVTVSGQSTGLVLNTGFIDRNFIDIFNLKLVSGSNFPANQPRNIEQYAMINEAAQRILLKGKNQKNGMIGQIVSVDSATVQIVGVLSDDSFQVQEVVPAIFRLKNSKVRYISVKSEAGADKIVASLSKKIWRQNFPGFIPEIYNFKEVNIRDYRTEMGKVNLSFGFVCGIIMLVSCLGIFGMANYAVSSNNMQIGIRKTFGASNLQVIFAITKPFMKILLLSGLIGIPLGWLSGSMLERRFGTHVDLGVVNLGSGFLFVVAVALSVVISQTFRSAYISPSEVLKGE